MNEALGKRVSVMTDQSRKTVIGYVRSAASFRLGCKT